MDHCFPQSNSIGQKHKFILSFMVVCNGDMRGCHAARLTVTLHFPRKFRAKWQNKLYSEQELYREII